MMDSILVSGWALSSKHDSLPATIHLIRISISVIWQYIGLWPFMSEILFTSLIGESFKVLKNKYTVPVISCLKGRKSEFTKNLCVLPLIWFEESIQG